MKKGGSGMSNEKNLLQGEKLRENLRENLRHMRLAAGRSQEEIARLLGVNRATYTYYETGKTTPSVVDLFWLAQFYRCPMEAFFAADESH